MSATLLPCPFCGSLDLFSGGVGIDCMDHGIICESCAGRGPAEESEAEAVTSWNRRAPVLDTGLDTGLDTAKGLKTALSVPPAEEVKARQAPDNQ